MKRAWLFFILALIGTATPAMAEEAAGHAQPPADIARRYVDAFLAGDMQTLLDHASPALKQLMKDAATVAALRDRSVGGGAHSADEEISVIYTRRVTSAGGHAFVIMAQAAPDGQLVAFSIQPAGEAPSKSPTIAEKSPFAAVRWQETQPEVKVGEEWFQLVSLNDLPAAEIIAFSQRTYGKKWQMRFEEDLVELLTRMGHKPNDTVQLVVRPLGSSITQTLEDVPMTRANRHAIRDARRARERDEQRPATRNAAPMEDAKAALADLIPRLRKKNNLVGLAAMAMVDGQVVASAVDGERKMGSGVRLEIGDRWHLGSITKSVTATMIARLVESSQMQWSNSIGFPDAAIHEDWKPVTLKQLLSHTAGAPPNFSVRVALNRPPLGPECTKARREAVLNVLAEKPAHPPGEKFAYSNVGYTIAGAMVEKATGAKWEDLVKREVFEPLELKGAGFGPPKSPAETLPQPRGHRKILGWKASMDDDADNTAIIGPAGIVHMTLTDLCTYATEHLRGDRGEGKLLSAETYKLLHAPVLDHYACGWVRKEPGEEIPCAVYWHNGSNTMWYALVVFIPEKNMVVAVTSNDGDVASAEAAAWEIVKASAKQTTAAADSPPRERSEQ